jgi:hypothetical protein
LLAELPERALRLGAGASATVASRLALDGEWFGGFVALSRDACLLAYARGASSIEDVDVAIYSDDGTSLAVDEGRDVHPTVLLCPPHPDRVYVAAHVVEGEGLVAVGAQVVPRERALIVARALGARGALVQGPRPADAWPGLEEAIRNHRGALGIRWEEFRRVALPVDARAATYVAVPVDADQCVDAVVVPDEEVAMLDVEAADDQGRIIARALEGSGPRALTVCSPAAMTTSLSVRPHVGRGLAAVVLARTTRDAARDLAERAEVAWVTPLRSVDAARSTRNALLAKRGYGAPTATAGGTVALGRRTSVPLDLLAPSRECARIDVVGGAPLAYIDARIWSESNALLASAESTASVTLFVCARVAARLEVESRGRPGPFAVLVRPEPWRDPVFAARPLAASRMLSRASGGPDMLLEGKEASVRAISLDSSHLVSWTEGVPHSQCLRVAIGAQGEGAGVELRAFEGVDLEVDRAHGAGSAAVRACARADAPRVIRFEARASAGELDAIVGERLETFSP